MQSLLIKKNFSQRTATTTSHRTQTNAQPQISSAKPYCELAVQYSIFVKTTVLRQHDSYPFAPIQILTGDTRKGCSSRRGRLPDERRSFSLQKRIDRRFESWVAGLRPACFLVTFCTTQKVTTRSLCREHRGFPNLESAHHNCSFAPQQLKPFSGNFEVVQTSN